MPVIADPLAYPFGQVVGVSSRPSLLLKTIPNYRTVLALHGHWSGYADTVRRTARWFAIPLLGPVPRVDRRRCMGPRE